MENNLKFWKRVSKFYTPLQEKANKTVYPTIVNATLPYLHEQDKALELACGTGQFSFSYAAHVKCWIASDYCKEMIDIAKTRQSTKAIFKVEDATNISYPDETFDIVFMANALHIIPDATACLTEIKRVLKPNGYAFLVTFVYEGKIPTLRLQLLEKVGFKTYHQWNEKTYIQTCCQTGFELIDHALFPATPLPESLLILKKK